MLEKVAERLNAAPPKKVPQKASEHKSPEMQKIQVQKGERAKSLSDVEPTKLNLDIAKKVAYAAELAAKAMNVNAVISIVNDGANLIYFSAMDDSYIASVKISQDKAYTAAALKMPTYKALEESRGGSLDGLTNGNGIMLLAGGEPMFINGKLVGAIGVSGGTKDEDALIARVAVGVFDNLIKSL